MIKENLTPVNADQAFEDSVSQCFPETTTLGWMQVDTVQAMKDYDTVSWEIAQSEWLMNEESEGLIATFDNGASYFFTSDIEQFLDEADKETEGISTMNLSAQFNESTKCSSLLPFSTISHIGEIALGLTGVKSLRPLRKLRGAYGALDARDPESKDSH